MYKGCTSELPLVLVPNGIFPRSCRTLHCENYCIIAVDLDSGNVLCGRVIPKSKSDGCDGVLVNELNVFNKHTTLRRSQNLVKNMTSIETAAAVDFST